MLYYLTLSSSKCAILASASAVSLASFSIFFLMLSILQPALSLKCVTSLDIFLASGGGWVSLSYSNIGTLLPLAKPP